MSKKLFENSSSDDEENENTNEFKTNEEYAKVYNKFRQKELLKKLKDRGLDEETESTSSDSSLSDEDVHDPKFDEEFYKTLSSIKSKDPSIYDKNAKFFENYDGLKKDNKNENHHEKALTLKDYERKIILEKGGVYEDDEDEIDEVNKRPTSPSYVQEEEKLRKEFKQILNNDDDDENEEFGGIFKKRSKTKEEQEKEEEDFIKWLAGKKEDIDKNKKEKLNPLKQYWNNPNLPKEEQFLRDYVLNNGYTNKLSKNIPTYEEIINDISEDEKELERQSEFEHKFNYRFEEPDKEFIKRYPRTIENSVRKIDDKRKLKRLETKERKQKEKEQKFKELELLKELKRNEIEEKIQKLKEVTGNEELPFNDIDLDEDFDPDAHDKRMKQIFDDDYYKIDEGEEKPECPDIDELKIEDWDNYDPKQDNDDDDYDREGYDYDENEPHCEDDDFVMDCDYEKNKEKLQNELIENSKNKRKRKRRRNRFMEIIKQDKPVFNPEDEKTYAEYIDEYYKMDCEDIIDDIPCRFKYVETVPNDFGLTIEEILLAKNKELNQWASLKKAVQIRPEHVERNEAKLYKMKAQNLKLKKKIFRSLYGSSSSDEEEEKQENSEKSPVKEGNSSKKEIRVDNTISKKIKKNLNVQQSTNGSESKIENDRRTNDKTSPIDSLNQLQKKRKKKNKQIDKGNNEQPLFKTNKNKNADNPFKNKKKHFDKLNSSNKTGSMSDERLKAYGLNPKKFHKKQKFEMKQKFLNKKNKS